MFQALNTGQAKVAAYDIKRPPGVCAWPDRIVGTWTSTLSYTVGAAITALKQRLGARDVAPLYGHVDPMFIVPST
jgi:hypothetical protein